MRLVSYLKNAIVEPRPKARKIVTGAFKGIVMNLSLRTQTQLYLGLFERETYPWLSRLSDGIETAIDIGIGYGEYTLYFLMKTRAKLIAFEPDERLLPSLLANLELNGQAQSSRLELVRKFVASSQNEKSVSLDGFLSAISSPCLIKMDVDGAEEDILSGAKEINSLHGIRWLIETHSSDLEIACQKILKASGFDTAIVPNASWRIFFPEERPVKQNRWLAAWKV
jgi:hypothetical protein